MSSWGTRRRNLIIFLFIFVAVLFSAIFVFFFYYEKPTCFDAKQNGDEDGIDCGGSCQLLCTNQTFEPIIHWKRFFEVVPGVYNAIAYIENQNPEAGAVSANYTFKLYDKNSVILVEKSGYIDIKPNQVTPIIENNLSTGKLEAARVSFDLDPNIKWQKQKPIGRLVDIRNQEIIEEDGLPRITATVYNNTLGTLENTKFVVIAYDINGNAVGVSNTVISRLAKDQNKNIIFTWPKPFSAEATRIEIIPIYDLSK